MNKPLHLHYIIVIFFLLLNTSASAQNYKWVKGGGSVDPMIASGIYERVTDVCTDDNRNVYILSPVGDDDITADTFHMLTSFFYGGSGNSAHQFIASYNCNGTMRWAKLLDAYNATAAGGYKGIAYSSGSIYVTGVLFSDSNYLVPNASYKYFGYDTIIHNINQPAFIARYDTSGKLKWVKFIGQDSLYTWFHNPAPCALSVDGYGYMHDYVFMDSGIVISPAMTSSQKGTYDLTYDVSGNLLNAVKMQIDSNWEVAKVIINKKNNIAYTTVYYPPGGAVEYYLAAFSPSGTQLWADSAGFVQALSGVAYDGNNAIYSVGASYASLGDPFIVAADSFYGKGQVLSVILKFDTLGHVKKGFMFDGTTTSVTALTDITLLPNGQIATNGTMAGTLKYGSDTIATPSGEGWNPVLAIIDTSGRLVKMDQLHGGGFYDEGNSITSDNVGDIYFGGQVESSIYAGSQYYSSHGGNTDYFVAKYGYNCSCTLATEPLANFTYTGNGTVTFTYAGSASPDSLRWDFGDGTISSATNPTHTFSDTGSHTVCLTVYACDSGTYCSTIHSNVAVSKIASLPQVSIYPNPFADELFIEHATTGMHISIYSIIGQEIYKGSITGEKQSINTSMLSPGTYILQLINPEGQKMSMTIVKQ